MYFMFCGNISTVNYQVSLVTQPWEHLLQPGPETSFDYFKTKFDFEILPVLIFLTLHVDLISPFLGKKNAKFYLREIIST